MLFLGVWEQLNNPDFNSIEFEGIRNEAGRNSFFLSAKKWVRATNAIAIVQMRSLLARPEVKRLDSPGKMARKPSWTSKR